jgi:hypothetical protein
MTELQLIERLLGMLGTAGEGAYSLILLAILKDYFVGLLTVTTLVFFITMGYRLCRGLSGDSEALDEIAKAADMCVRDHYQRQRVCNAVIQYRKEHNDRI